MSLSSSHLLSLLGKKQLVLSLGNLFDYDLCQTAEVQAEAEMGVCRQYKVREETEADKQICLFFCNDFPLGREQA